MKKKSFMSNFRTFEHDEKGMKQEKLIMPDKLESWENSLWLEISFSSVAIVDCVGTRKMCLNVKTASLSLLQSNLQLFA